MKSEIYMRDWQQIKCDNCNNLTENENRTCKLCFKKIIK